MDISSTATVLQLTLITTSWEHLAEVVVLDALMPTCWHVLWLWWHPQLQGSDWCLKSEITLLAECWTLSPDKKQVYGFPSDVSASVIVYERPGPLLPANSANHPPPLSGWVLSVLYPYPAVPRHHC